MKRKVLSNIFSSGIEKFFIIGVQFLSSILLIRLLPRDDYGVIGIVAGYFAFVNFINVSFESIILRDHKVFDERLEAILQTFFAVNILKSLLFLSIASVLTALLPMVYDNNGFIYAIWSITFIMIADSMTAPFVLYFASKFNQKLVTKLSVFRYFFGLTLLTGLFAYPHLWYIAVKDLAVSTVFIIVWFYLARKKIHFKPAVHNIDFAFVRESFFRYSLWTHLNGVVTNIIYRSDTFFLSFFVSLSVVGNYNIALNSANIANILPSILGYQNSIALSHARDDDHASAITNAFIRLSAVIGFATLTGFYFLGELYLYLITGEHGNDDIFFFMMSIVASLVLVKTLVSPINSFINIHGNVQAFFRNVTVYLLCFAVVVYLTAAYLWGGYGMALSNILIALFWLFMVIRESRRYHYNLKGVVDTSSEFTWLKKVIKR